MDQLCINQEKNREKDKEVPKMKQYYSNATVTLISINTSYGNEKNIDLEEVLKKIVNSEWFARS